MEHILDTMEQETNETDSDCHISLYQPMGCLDTSPAPGNGPIKFNAIAAMCHGNRGIGYKMHLPWPRLKKDYDYYTGLTSTLKGIDSDDKKIVQIHGRYTWICTSDINRSSPNVFHVIVSRTWTERDCTHPRVLKVVPTFDDAMTLINGLYQCNDVDSVWVMGGSNIYKEALFHPQCNCLYLTHVYTDFPADVFFPEFEENFQEIDEHPEKGVEHEDNSVKYEFKVYAKKLK